jgi:hypothetical protein
VDDLGGAEIVGIKMASMKKKDQCVFWFHETKSPWVILQQDGAPLHWGLLVRPFLDATFPKRWIGRDGPTPWPPRSPDITHLDFLWGCVKDKMYSTPISNTDTLKARIRDALAVVTEEMLEKTWREIAYKLNVLRTTDGAHVEVY